MILLTDAGTEGLSLSATETIHIVSPKVIMNKINQVIGRIRRLHSHDSLPPTRQFVNIYTYLTTFNPLFFFKRIPNTDPKRQVSSELMSGFAYPKSPADFEEDSKDVQDVYHVGMDVSSDIEIYRRAVCREHSIQQALHILQRSSLETHFSKEDLMMMKLQSEFTPEELRLLITSANTLDEKHKSKQRILERRHRDNIGDLDLTLINRAISTYPSRDDPQIATLSSDSEDIIV